MLGSSPQWFKPVRVLETELADRVLRFDGVSVVHPDHVAWALSRGLQPSQLRVTEEDEDVLSFNQQVIESERLRLAEPEPIDINMVWQLPKAYLDLDLYQRVVDEFSARLPSLGYTPEQEEQAAIRIQAEMSEIVRRGMVEFTKTIIYILDTFRKNNIVWGVGRGSSCASYVLFILGLHVVDCIKLDVPLTEFFHD